MENSKPRNASRASGPDHGSNYWQLLAAAEDALDVGDFPAAERRYLDTCDLRDTSPGRVFVTEKIGDSLRRLWRRGAAEVETAAQAGRWTRTSRAFVDRFKQDGEPVVREGVRLAELRPEDDAETNQPILESALFLVARSRIFQDEPASAVPLLKGLFRTASRTGRPFSVELVRHDLPLTEEDRLWMARRGGELVEAFVEQGHLRQGAPEAEEWAHVFLQLLQARYFGTTGRLEEERAWLEALTADRLVGRADSSVDLYRAYLAVNPAPGPRADEARVRLFELLGNIDAVNFPVPRYAEALGAMQAAGLAPGSAVSARYTEAVARLEHRRPDGHATGDHQAPAWGSVGVEREGRVAVVYWWDNEPRDVAFWSPGADTAALDEFLAPCAGRLLAADEATMAVVSGRWAADLAPWAATEFVAAIMESRLPATGLAPGVVLRLALAETSPWRSGWRVGLGHPLLEPPHSSTLAEAWQQGTAAAALQAGLAFLAVRSRVAEADLAVRAGIGEMARRGDPASRFLYGFLTLKSDTQRALDASFEPWTLPLLWTRPDPFGWSATESGTVGTGGPTEAGIRPNLGRSDLTIVTTGNAPAVLAAWGDGKQKWRVVLDRLDRLETLTQVAGGVMGPVTLIPQTGQVHSLQAALQLLEDLLAVTRPGADGLLALFHWTRLCETHNGDLLDFQQVRPRPDGAIALYERYAEVITEVATEQPSLAVDGSLDTDTLRTWGAQFSQRVRKAGLVAGTVAQLSGEARTMDSLWGVFDGSDATWVFLDSAAVHWTLYERGDIDIPQLHTLLHSRGRRHLSLLSAAAWQRSELEELLAAWLQVFGDAYCVSLTDTRAPVLRLADRGVRPQATLLAAEELAGQLTWIQRKFGEEGAGTVRLPRRGRPADFWRQIRSGQLPLGGADWRYLDETTATIGLPDAALVVPELISLAGDDAPVARHDTRAAWLEADTERAAFYDRRRQLCALEIASLMAGHWRSVDILDTRWWRLLRPLATLSPTSETLAPVRPWDAEEAAQLATNGTARTFDLPQVGTQSARSGPLDQRILEVVREWLAQQPDSTAPAAESAATLPELEPGVRLFCGDLDPVWSGLRADLTRAWDRGELNRWVLVVADAVPSGAAELVAAGSVAGLSVWAGRQADGSTSAGLAPGDLPAPVVWTEPEDFADPALRHMLLAQPPAVIVADDLSDWLPNVDRDAQETAVALRAILDSGAQTVILHASSLTSSWSGFLADACGAALVVADQGDGNSRFEPEFAAEPAAPLCLDCGRPDRPAALASRLRVMLSRLRKVLSSVTGAADHPDGEPAPAVGRQLVPLDWLGRLAGMTRDEVSEGVLLLRWAARLNGDSLSAAGVARGGGVTGGHTLIIATRFAELETTLDRLGENLALLVPLWLDGATVPGLLGRVDLEQPPVRIDAHELALVDAFLSAVADGHSHVTGLVYGCPRGLLNSATRLVGWDGSSHDVLPALLRALDLFRRRIGDVLGTAVETGAGFRVETGLTELRAEEREFMALGVVMGFWRWLGPRASGAIHLVDLLTVADSPTVKQSPLGWDLFRAQLAPRFPVTVAAAPVLPPRADKPEVSQPRLGPLRRLLSGGLEASDDLDPVVARVHALTSGPGDPAFLVLKGMLGSGRHEALVRGLLRTRHEGDDPGEVTIFCPDQATGAMVTREFLQCGYAGPLDVRVPARGGGVPAGPNVLPALADPASAVIVMCEVQRFDAETRYRVAQMGRGKLLVMTADAVASAEPWEHLFLTTPRANDIVELTGQRRLGKAIWSEVRGLAPESVRTDRGTRRHTRGNLESGYAANLVQSLARVVAAHDEGTLPGVLRLTTPVTADLEYLGAQLRERGWLAVFETRLDALMLPGPREILAAATDELARSGELALAFSAGVATGPTAAAMPDTNQTDDVAQSDAVSPGPRSPVESELMMPMLLGSEARSAWQEWITTEVPDAELTLAAFVGRLVGTPWANTFLRHREARRRCEELLAEWGGKSLRGLLALPQWEVWWHLMNDDLGASGAPSRRPVVLLSDLARVPGCWVPGGVYLCLGNEPVRQHYQFLGRVTDSALVLYQERSPLPGDAGSA